MGILDTISDIVFPASDKQSDEAKGRRDAHKATPESKPSPVIPETSKARTVKEQGKKAGSSYWYESD